MKEIKVGKHTPGPCICGYDASRDRFEAHTQACIANAKLIAAAPDLAEALREIIETPDGHVKSKGEMFRIAKAALAKAGL